MRVPAALERWAAEHNDQLSQETLDEVQAIADTIAASDLGDLRIDEIPGTADGELAVLFTGARSERATALVQIVAEWVEIPGVEAGGPATDTEAATDPTEHAADIETPVEPDASPTDAPIEPDPTALEAPIEPAASPTALERPPQPAADSFEPPVEVALGTTTMTPPVVPAPPTHDYGVPRPAGAPVFEEPIKAPAFLRSDKVDEEDGVRLYGPKRRWNLIIGTIMLLLLIGAAAVTAWYLLTQRDTDEAADDAVETTASATTEPEDTEPAGSAEPTAVPETEPTTAPTAVPQPTPLVPSYWADTTPILNSGAAEILSSTYAVSPANRAVLTGHTAAITGIVVSDAGRVLTSGADRRLVDWGADVTLASPDVLSVPAPLTVLARTVDQRILAGDNAGNVTVIDLVNSVDPIVLPVHPVAISAAAELADGRFAIASVDGDVAVFAAGTPDEVVSLDHAGEVTAVVALADGRVATASVDGIVRLWPPDGSDEPGEIDTLGAPVTGMTLLSDGVLAMSSLDGAIQLVRPEPGAAPAVEIPGHVGAVRALAEVVLPDGTTVLASGGDDTTVRLWDIRTGDELRVLEGHGDIVSGVNMLPDGRLVSISGDGTGRVWDLTIPPGTTVTPPHDWNLSAVHPWGNDQFVSGGVDGKVVLASTAETSEPLLITRHSTPIVGVSVLGNGDIVSLDAASVLRVNNADGSPAGLVEISIAAGATALDVVDGSGVVTGHADGSVRFHDFTEEVAVFDAHGSGVNDVIALTNGMVVSAGQDMTVRIIDPENPDLLPVFDLHSAPVDVVIELPDGRIASAGTDWIYVWSLEGLAQDHIRLSGNRSRTISLAGLSNDRLLSTGADGRVRIWDLNSPDSEPTTLVDIPGIVNPYLIEADNGLFVAGAARGYVVFSLS